jgi:hypothetical protein
MDPIQNPTVAMELARHRMTDEHARAAAQRAAHDARKAARDSRLVAETRRRARFTTARLIAAVRLGH